MPDREITFVLPGDDIDPSLIPSHPKKPLRLGPGVCHVPPHGVFPTLAGELVTDRQKNSIRVDSSSGRYIPRVGELVIGTINKTAAEAYLVLLTPYTTPALLPQLSFESATKKTRPILQPGALVYARVSLANKHMDAELECVSSSTGKADGLGPLTGGMLFEISLGMARRLMMPPPASHGMTKKSEQNEGAAAGGAVVVLEELAAAGLRFETATGRNGRLWVDSDKLQTVIAVGRAVQETDERRLGLDEQRKLVKKLIKNMS